MIASDEIRAATVDRILNQRLSDDAKVLLLRKYVATRLADPKVLAALVAKLEEVLP